MQRATTAVTRSLLGVGALLAVLPISFVIRSAPSLFFKPLDEDGFYSLAVARNLALGHGLTIDGTHLTNGFQPLVTLVDALAFLDHGNRVLGVRLVLVFSWVILLATCGVVALIARDLATNATARRLAPALAVVALLSGRYVLYAFNGLETGGEILTFALLWRLYQVRGIDKTRDAVLFGGALGFAVLVRVDAVALVAATMVLLVLVERRRSTAVRAMVVAGSAALVSSPWWIYNQLEFGHLLPTSGEAEESVRLAFSRFPSLAIGVAQDVIPWGYTARTQTIGFSVVELIVAGAIAWWILRRPLKRSDPLPGPDDRYRRGRHFGVAIGGSMAVLALFYFVETDAVWFYGRYLAPAILVSAVGGVAALVNRELGRPPVLAAIVAAALVIGVSFAFHFDRNATSPYYVDQLGLITAHVPPTAYVAAGQSGTIGFMRARVVNLDGKVNQAALDHQGDIRAYLESEHIVWLCDQADYVRLYLSADPARFGWVEVASHGGFFLWHDVGVSAATG